MRSSLVATISIRFPLCNHLPLWTFHAMLSHLKNYYVYDITLGGCFSQHPQLKIVFNYHLPRRGCLRLIGYYLIFNLNNANKGECMVTTIFPLVGLIFIFYRNSFRIEIFSRILPIFYGIFFIILVILYFVFISVGLWG